ncbi:hypothetical protein MNBD_GAMMA22-2057 [hydrothermal vent metagenome]|uniref:MSHA biogenesis protein MshJ n=1 Tax=hydrothermal vent metagenome TaxID=652676 RepID=A0A3B1AP52_9ZZZZ
MNNYIKIFYEKFDALQQREKAMVAGLIIVLLISVWQLFIFDEAALQSAKLNNLVKLQQQENVALNSEIAAYRDRRVNNPNIKLKQQQDLYMAKIETLDTKLNKKMKGLISPKKMTLMLKDILKSNASLTLLSLEKLQTESMFDFSDNNKIADQKTSTVNTVSVTDDISEQQLDSVAVVYRHPVRIVFTGSYLNTLTYLEILEKMPWDLYWENVQLNVEKYPVAKIVITVFTLSLKKGWVGV